MTGPSLGTLTGEHIGSQRRRSDASFTVSLNGLGLPPQGQREGLLSPCTGGLE